MKITNTEVIKKCEKELIDAITGDLDWSAIERIFKNKHNLEIQDDVEYKQGDIVVHDNEIAYKLDFDVKVTFSILFDRDGNTKELSTSESFTELPEDAEQAGSGMAPNENVAEMASQIGNLISDING